MIISCMGGIFKDEDRDLPTGFGMNARISLCRGIGSKMVIIAWCFGACFLAGFVL